MAEASKSSRNTIVTVVAIYLVVSGILALCGSIALVTGGALFGALGSLPTEATAGLTEAERASLSAAVSEVGATGGLITVLGIVTLVISIAQLIIAVGLFQKKPWAWRATIGVLAISILISLLTTVFGGGINLVGIIIGAAIAYLFYTNQDVRADLGVASGEKLLPSGPI